MRPSRKAGIPVPMKLALLSLALLAAASAARADEVDLTPQSRSAHKPITLALRAEGGSNFAPYGYAGACLSYLGIGGLELEGGAGAGFPGVQAGLALRELFDPRGGFVAEIAFAGNTKINRGGPDNPLLTPGGQGSHLWTSLGLGFEQRSDGITLGLIAGIVFTTSDLTPHFVVHGGLGFALF